MRPAPRHVRNAAAEAAAFRVRALIGFGIVLACLGGLGAWYFKLQVLDHDDYAKRSEANRIKPRPVVPGRGLIYDRRGRILADNIPAYRLDVTPEDAGDLDRLLAGLSKVVALTAEDVTRFRQQRRGARGFRAITLKLRLNEEEIARLAVDRWRFPGVEVVPYLTRRYPYGELFAHVIGYVGRTDEDDLQRYGAGHAVFTHTGRTGLERFYDDALRGRPGYEQVETNVEGRALGRVGLVPATAGADLRLSIDADLQRAIVLAFGEFEGAAVAMDPRSGEVLAMVSLPSYDANLFVNGIGAADYRALTDNPSRPQFNRLVLGGVAPGSTLKPLIALAGLDSGLRRPEDRVMSTGMFHMPGVSRGWGDAARGGHGSTDLRKSIAQSVNTYYYRLGLDLGIERFDDYMQRYGFGQPSGIDLTGEIGGILPSPAWKRQAEKTRWYPGDTLNASIGQGGWKVTPLQLVRAIGGIADGRLHRPHLVSSMRTGFDADWRATPQPEPSPMSPNAGNVAIIRDAMMATMQPGGTGARMAQGAPYLMAGKTGTAQVASRRGTASVNPRNLPMHLRHRSLFVGFAPADAPTIVISIAVEGGGYGGTTAAPIARKIFDAWLLGKMPPKIGPDGEPVPDPFANVVSGAPAFEDVVDGAAPTTTAAGGTAPVDAVDAPGVPASAAAADAAVLEQARAVPTPTIPPPAQAPRTPPRSPATSAPARPSPRVPDASPADPDAPSSPERTR